MYAERIVRGDIFEVDDKISDTCYIIIVCIKNNLEGKKFNPMEPKDFHYEQLISIRKEDLIKKYGHVSMRTRGEND